MRTGKVKESILKRSVLRQLHSETGCGSPGGEGGSLSDGDTGPIVLRTVPVEGWTLAAKRAVYGAVNALAAAGAAPESLAPIILMPEGTQESALKQLIGEMDALCVREGIAMKDGHTAVSPFVTSLVLSVTAVGRRPFTKASSLNQDGAFSLNEVSPQNGVFSRDGAFSQDGDLPQDGPLALEAWDVVAAGTVGREGAAMIACEQEQALLSRYAASYIEEAKHLFDDGSMRKAAAIGWNAGAAAIKNVREGGVFAGLWELAGACKAGLHIDLASIPIKQHTIEVCEFFRLNPYMLRSGGTLLLVCSRGEAVAEAIRAAGIAAAVIGQTTNGNDRMVRYDGETRYLEPPKQDEYYKALTKFAG